jgi:hypothetical protein
MIAVADSSSGILIINVNSAISIRHYLEGSTTFYHEITTRPILMDLAYRRLGHISESRVKALASEHAEGLKLLPNGYRLSKCDHCIIEKIKILSYSRKQPILRRANRPIEILYIDLLQGPCAVLRTSFEYLLIIVDDYTRMAWYIGLKTKNIREI